ncbi:elongation factor P maturation arginine rhamnosyltransferase EarP [Iodobacter sp. CM08]|uniref:elongation factor P maturation arginine rhamnosyltransferase EarP n=1 Tax=Iodobacter sp. CM08 TaxID=3085902 RepID=UPI002981BD4A|nr:elongation factor P maturation arginine rhamnosyltransferase EarP [Iodobacter sp. CM08]MDW5416830.1 elongation factor P maturation arginine rhamnosyltransferase EarP [Iodobacter sp. CM08]
MSNSRWDIFCRVVDNYGDIGVCWRLARQLHAEYGFTVRLMVDDLASFQRIQSDIALDQCQQQCSGVEVLHWREPAIELEPSDVVIEAFACDLPASYIAAMKAMPSDRVWLNLEYLSGEDWVLGCHGLPSPAQGLPKFFFFPGFVDGTGGVLGELVQRVARAAWLVADADAYLAQWQRPQADSLKISLFAYANSGLAELLQLWQSSSTPVQVFMPEGLLLPLASAALGQDLCVGQTIALGSLTLTVLPMQSQDDYDRLLWSCDLNFVRGEDSFVRAQWAGLPMVWHIYPQDDDAHRVKLAAFLMHYLATCPREVALVLNEFWLAWNHAGDLQAAWHKLLPALPSLREHAQGWAEQLLRRGDLATNLVKFVNSKVKYGVKF